MAISRKQCKIWYVIHCVPKNVHLLFFQQLCRKLTDFNDFCCVKSWENLTSIACTLPTLPVYCSHFTLGNPKKSFSTVLFIHTSDYLCYLRKKLLPPHPPHLKNVTTLPCKMQNFYIWLQIILRSSKCGWLWKEPVVGWHWWLWKWLTKEIKKTDHRIGLCR